MEQFCTEEVINDGKTLRFTLIPDMLPELEEKLSEENYIDFSDVIENQLCNGWHFLQPEQIGALTAAPILTDDVIFDDEGNGDIKELGRVFWFPNYQILDPVRVLAEKGSVDFDLALQYDDED